MSRALTTATRVGEPRTDKTRVDLLGRVGREAGEQLEEPSGTLTQQAGDIHQAALPSTENVTGCRTKATTSLPNFPVPAQHRVSTLLPTLARHPRGSWCPLPRYPSTPAPGLSAARLPVQLRAHPLPLGSVTPFLLSPAASLVSLILNTHAHRHSHRHTWPYRKAAINPEARAGFQSRDHIAKVREAGKQEADRVRFGGRSRKEEISCER